ncbi:hypothetical protein SLS62_011204 [Diatrype stigma]|uniref:Pyruvate decarboxylase n=1 Tax=Diatrype stigma TaxID=117547 RepID=A0AAN9U589_9PEZI
MSATIKLAEYLFTRLKQLGVESVHGVPGDFNLTLLDHVQPSGLHWVGNANELNAGYAADGYARTKGVGALITTFGVGELSAINAIAGAYAERAAVVHIVGTPERFKQDSRLLVHHTFNDGEYGRFSRMHAEITIAQASLRDPRTSPGQIDEVLRQCILHSRPVYIEVPVDLVGVPVSAEGLSHALRNPDGVPSPASAAALAEVLERIYRAKQPALLVDGETRPLGIGESVQAIVSSTGWPTWLNTFGKGLVDETGPNVHGVYRGKWDDPAVQKFIGESDLVLCFGPHFSSTNSFGFTSVPNPQSTILFTDTEVRVGEQVFRDVPAKSILAELTKALDLSKVKRYEPYPDLPRDQLSTFSSVSADQPIAHDSVWRILANFLKPGDIVMGETGTAGYGAREMPLPPHTSFFSPVTWLSIGYMLGAAQGAALAQQELIAASKYHGVEDARTILFIGDGSFQMTVQELGTIIRLNLNVIVFLINNDGYTIERCIHGLKQEYNDVTSWRYLQAPSFFGAREDTYTAQVRTYGDLEKVLSDPSLNTRKGLKMIEVFMDREDAPKGPLSDFLQAQKA